MSDTQIVGIDPTKTSTTAEYELGTQVTVDGKMYEYIRAGEALTANYAGYFRDNSACFASTTARIGASPVKCGVPNVAFANGHYGWIQRSGNMNVFLGLSCAANVQIYTTATLGLLDDNSSSTTQIQGLFSTVTVGGANAVSACVALVPLTANC